VVLLAAQVLHFLDGPTVELAFRNVLPWLEPGGAFDDYWQPILQGAGPPGAYVAGLPPEHRDALRDALQARLQGGKPDRGFSLGAKALAVRGVVPEA